MLEVEIKLPVENLAAVRDALKKQDFVYKESRTEEDRYFDNEDAYIRKNGYAFRIRQTTWPDTGRQAANLNFKGKKSDTVSMTREEIETGIEDAAAMLEIIHALGYSQKGPVLRKERSIYSKTITLEQGNTVIEACLDQVDGLGPFLELEIMAEEKDYNASLNYIEEILHELGYRLEDTVRTSYLSMLVKRLENAK